jgi:hypothetical protein
VNYGTNKTFTITPNANYHVADVLVDGSSVGAITSYTFNNVTANHTISASFAINTFTVTPSAGTGGSISPSTPQTVNYNVTTSFTVTPSTGYHIASVNGTCGGSLVGNTYTTNAITADCTVAASFAINTYTVTPSAGAGGTIGPSTPQTVNYNVTTLFTVTPNTGYHAVMSGTCGGSLVGNTYTTNAITADCTVVANFAIDTHTVTPSAGTGGSINPSTPQTVNYNATPSFTVTPSTGYHIASVNGTCGGTLVGNTYTTNAVTANCTVGASFAVNTYTVTPSAGAGGSISPSTPQTVNYNATPSFTLSPSTGYHITSVNGTCGGSLVGNTYTTNEVMADCTVVANFAIDTHTVTPSAGTGGSINPSIPQTVNYNQTTSFTVTPNTGYHAVMSGTCGGTLVGNTYTTNAVTADCTVTASFAVNTYTVTPSAGAGGSISPSTPQTVNFNATPSFTVTPSTGYHMASVNGSCGGTLSGNTYTTGSITSDCGVSATFAANVITHAITASAGTGGSISPSGSVSVHGGASQTFNVTANSGYHITIVSVDSSSVGAVSSYTFTDVTADHTIIATFAADTGVSIPAGTHSNYTVDLGDGVTAIFSQITGPCSVSKTISEASSWVAPPGFRFASVYDISHTGCSTSGPITVTIPYNESALSGKETSLRLFHRENGIWNDVTVSVDTGNNTITGQVTSLSPFGAGYPYSGGYTTGANTYVIAFLALIAIATGVILIKKGEWLRNM